MRKVDLATGKVIKMVPVDPKIFAEGIVVMVIK
jgi:glutamine cyclotransferase